MRIWHLAPWAWSATSTRERNCQTISESPPTCLPCPSGTDRATLQGFVTERAADGATVYTDDHASYKGIPYPHKAVKHSVSEYVKDQAHTNGIESFWATLKRGYHGTYHHVSEKHLSRYVAEFEGRHNSRPADAVDQIGSIVQGMEGKRLKYKDLIA